MDFQVFAVVSVALPFLVSKNPDDPSLALLTNLRHLANFFIFFGFTGKFCSDSFMCDLLPAHV